MTDDDITLGELARRIESMDKKLDGIRADAVLRVEYDARMTALDREVRDLKSDVAVLRGEMRAETKESRPSWWTLAPIALAAVTLAVLLIQSVRP